MSARVKWVIRALVALSAAALLLFVARAVDLPQKMLLLVELGRGAGLAGALLYGVVYVASAVLLIPGSVLTLAAGFAWGPVWGVALVSPASVLAATAAFALGRTLLRGHVERRIGSDPRVAAIDRALGESGFKLVLLLRLSPVLPFNLLNYALSLTRVRLRDFVLGSALGMFPATVLFVHVGSLVTSGAELLSGRRPSAGAAGSVLTWAGLLATLAVVVLVTRVSRAALQKALAEQAP